MTQSLFDAIAAVKAAEGLGEFQKRNKHPEPDKHPEQALHSIKMRSRRSATDQELQKNPFLFGVEIETCITTKLTQVSGGKAQTRTDKYYYVDNKRFRSLKSVRAYMAEKQHVAVIFIVTPDGRNVKYYVNPLHLKLAGDLIKLRFGSESGLLYCESAQYAASRKLSDIVNIEIGGTYVFGVTQVPTYHNFTL